MKKRIMVVVMMLVVAMGVSTKIQGAEKARFWTWKGTEELRNGETKDIMVVQQLSQKFNVTFENPAGDAGEEFNIYMTTGNGLPDAIMYNYSPNSVEKYARSKRLLDISPYLAKVPNLKKMLDSNPKLKAQITSESGKIYYFPWITEGKVFYEGLMLRSDWLKATGLPTPTTNEELYKVLKKEKELFSAGKLPNAGTKFYGLSGWQQQIQKLAYGFDTVKDLMISKDGKTVVYGPATSEYREAMKWYYKMAKEGLIDPDVYSGDRDLYLQHHLNNLTAGFIDNPGEFEQVALSSKNKIQFTPVSYMKNKDGKMMEYNSTAKRIAQPYGYSLTSAAEKNKKIDDILAFWNYVYSPEGQNFVNWGIEGDTYKVVKGEKVYTDKIMKDPKYAPGIAQSKYVKTDLGKTDLKTNFALADETAKKAMAIWAKTDVSRAMEPLIWMTDAEKEISNAVKTDLGTSADEWTQKFITGQVDPSDDKKWNEFQNQLKALKVSEYEKANTTAYQRFMARVNKK